MTAYAEETFGCPGCRDLGILLHERSYPKLQPSYTATIATPCPECARGTEIERGWTEHTEAKAARKTKRRPNYRHFTGTEGDA